MTTTDFDRSTLSWVRRELDNTLREAAQALEAFSEDRDDESQLRFCATYLHQVFGTLQMLELYSVSMLAGEMERLVEALLGGAVENVPAAEEQLMTGILRCGTLLEEIEQGQQDSPAAVLELINGLRDARGERELDEGLLLPPELGHLPRGGVRQQAGPDLFMCAGRLRGVYQRALLMYIRGRQPARSLEKLAEVLETLEAAAPGANGGGVWSIAAAVVEGLRHGGLEANRTFKRLLGHVERQLKRVVDQGETAAVENLPEALLRSVLVRASMAPAPTGRLLAIREYFGLEGVWPLDAPRPVGPGAEIIEGVAGAIREDVTGIKDTLDLYVRTANVDKERLQAAAGSMNRVADTLGMLGLSAERDMVKGQLPTLLDLADGQEAAEDAQMELARALLHVESSLDALQQDGVAPATADGESDALDDTRLFDQQFRSVRQATIREAVADVGAVKEAVVHFIERDDRQALDGVAGAMRRLEGALQIIELGRAARLVDAIREYLKGTVVEARGIPGASELDALADAVTSLEYYLEAELEQRGGREAILDVAERSLEQLAAGTEEAATPAAPDGDADTDTRPEVAEPSASLSGGPDPAVVEDAVSAAPAEDAGRDPGAHPATGASDVNLRVAVRAEDQDADILEIFLEEVDEVLESIHECLPRWQQDPEASDVLVTLRRMWHTLKGSGRLAGALLLGEMAWSVERLLNRVIEGKVTPEENVRSLVGRAAGMVPALAAELRDGTAPDPGMDVRGLMAEAQALADGGTGGAGLPVSPESAGGVNTGEADENAAAASHVSAAAGLDDTVAVDMQSEPGGAGDQAATADTLDTAAIDEDEASASRESAAGADEPGTPGDPAEAADLVADDDAFESHADHGSDPDGQTDGFPDPAGHEADAAPPRAGADAPDGAADSDDEETGSPEDSGATTTEAVDAEPPGENPIEPTAPDGDADVGQPGEEAGSEAREDEARQSTPAIDPALYEIFRAETMDHLSVVNSFIAGCRAQGAYCAVTEGLSRALHTLAGSARMADVAEVATLSRSLEQFVGLCHEQSRRLDQEDNSLLDDGAARIRELLDALGDREQEMPAIGDILDRVAAHSASKHPPASAEQHAGSGHGAVSPGVHDGPDEELVGLFLEEAEDILQFLEGTVERWVDEAGSGAALAELFRSLHTLKGGARLAGFEGFASLCHALEGLAGDVERNRVPADDRFFDDLTACLDALNRMILAARTGEPMESPALLLSRIDELRSQAAEDTGAPVPAEADAGGQDEELVEVFLEESAEILQGIEASQVEWVERPDDQGLLRDIQRALHTLKGGARMAGFVPMADLSHAVETLLNGVQLGSVEQDASVLELLELCHDRLQEMREQAVAGQSPAPAVELLRQVENRCGGAVEAPAAAEVVPLTPQQAPQIDQPERAPGSDQVRVRAEVLDNLVNHAGEVSIYRARLDQQVGAFRFNLTELDQTVSRLREQLRTLEIETEAQILYRFEREPESDARDEDDSFDPLELDRFSRMQELSRALVESVNDLSSIEGMLDNLAREAETLLLQQSRVNTELQDGLMRTRMVPFANLAPRLRRIVRQTAQELGKRVQLRVQGGQGEMDRNVLERITAPLEHMLRNAVAHGIEEPDARARAGKAETGHITVALEREGADLLLRVGDDGSGMNLDAIRRKAVDRGLMRADAELTDREIMQFVLEQGFSTAEAVTQVAGRGVGMDVVNAEIKQLGGSLDIDSQQGDGTRFTVRLPFTLAMNQALLCTAADQAYAIPLTSIDGVVRLSREQLEAYFKGGEKARYHYAGQDYQVRSLAQLLGTAEPGPLVSDRRIPVVLVQSGDHRIAIQVDGLIGAREIVVKSVGAQISNVPGIFGATILADGRVVFILDVGAMLRVGSSLAGDDAPRTSTAANRDATIMVVDDSITMRKVATRLLEKNGMHVVTAKDGVDAVAMLQDNVPHAMLLDIEMPRMDGYELATHMRNDDRLKAVPILMITSRTGDKHRQRALDIGVDRYMGKPYQESELMDNLRELLESRHGIGG